MGVKIGMRQEWVKRKKRSAEQEAKILGSELAKEGDDRGIGCWEQRGREEAKGSGCDLSWWG